MTFGSFSYGLQLLCAICGLPQGAPGIDRRGVVHVLPSISSVAVAKGAKEEELRALMDMMVVVSVALAVTVTVAVVEAVTVAEAVTEEAAEVVAVVVEGHGTPAW